MTDIKTSIPVADTTAGLNAAIDDEAYLMSMVEADESLLPSNMTFTGLFEGDNEFNPEELTGKLLEFATSRLISSLKNAISLIVLRLFPFKPKTDFRIALGNARTAITILNESCLKSFFWI